MSSILRRLLAFVAAVALISAAPDAIAQLQNLHVTDAEGREVSQLALVGTKVVVLVFGATDCPISNRYIPEVARLDLELSAKGVAFWWVFPNPGDAPAVVRKHGVDYSIDTPTLIDSRQDLVRMAHVSVTPEAAVFAVENGKLREVYHGRIDDRYISLGQERPQAGHHDLELAITAALAAKPVPQPAGPPVGCSIVFLQK